MGDNQPIEGPAGLWRAEGLQPTEVLRRYNVRNPSAEQCGHGSTLDTRMLRSTARNYRVMETNSNKAHLNNNVPSSTTLRI